MNFYKFLSTFVGHFCPPGSGSGSTDPIEYGSNPDPDPDPDPQPWYLLGFFFSPLPALSIFFNVKIQLFVTQKFDQDPEPPGSAFGLAFLIQIRIRILIEIKSWIQIRIETSADLQHWLNTLYLSI
jgi:hypothetical protein